MINVTLDKAKPKEKPFPKLMKSKEWFGIKDRIVFFISDKCGICLCVGSIDNLEVGEYSSEWNMEAFTDYNEPITIQNA